MNHQIAQVAALACHLNARCRGFALEKLFPGNSTCRFCEFVRFVQIVPTRIGNLSECIETPDQWIEELVRNGVSRGVIAYALPNLPPRLARLSAHVTGDVGDWWIGVNYRGQFNYWQPFWRVGHDAIEGRPWRVQYDETNCGPPAADSALGVAELSEQLSAALAAFEKFAADYHLGWLATRLRTANRSLAADGEQLVAAHYHNDLAPAGSLSLPCRRLLACCEDAWVFGRNGLSDDERIALEGVDKRSYCLLSHRLFDLVRRSICAAVNDDEGSLHSDARSATHG
jgi:hypothetical protein